MKTWTMMAVMLLVMQTSAWAQAPAVDGGTEGGNGGDPVAAEVSRAFLDVLAHLRATPELYPTIDRDVAERTILGLRVNVLAGATVACDIEGERRDVAACNYAARGEVDVARGGWARTSAGNGDQFRLAAHELLGLLQIRDPAYLVSGQIRDSRRRAIARSFRGVFNVSDISGPTGIRARGSRESISGIYQIRQIGGEMYLRIAENGSSCLYGEELPLSVDFGAGTLYSQTFPSRVAYWTEGRLSGRSWVERNFRETYFSVEFRANRFGVNATWFISGAFGGRYRVTAGRRD